MSRNYIFGPMLGVPGYIEPSDALIFQAVLEHQRQEGLAGGAVELGVYLGRSYFLIREHLAPGEKIVACDMFHEGPNTDGVSEQLRMFRRIGDRLGHPIDDELLLVGVTDTLTPADLLGRAGLARFVSIDAGHRRHNVANDSGLAAAVMAPHGVIAFDDFFNPDWPDVTTGVFDFFAAHAGRFAPFCISGKKLYACERGWAERYGALIAGSPLLAKLPRERRDFLGDGLVVVQHPIGKRAVVRALSRVGLGAMTRFLY